ncbi:hypothetical protein [Streptomyces sp. NPDC090021]|uniref:hypothetical protein n=1 Tax=Streptomyces sp. NPDC090021 TaxID=3365919 RepID=UPI0037FFAF28
MSFHPRAVPRRTGVRVRPLRALFALLVLSAFTAALIGCLVHDGRPPSRTVLAQSAPAHHHEPAAHGSRGVPHPDDPCVLHLAPRGVPEAAAPRTAGSPALLVALLALLVAVSPARVGRRASVPPGTAGAGRRTRTRICCWRI